MSKYIRNDDMNDDNEVYRGEHYEGMTIFKGKGSGEQPLKVFGKNFEDKVLTNKVKSAILKLSPKERTLLKLICEEGYSIRAASKRMGIAQQTAQGYWINIKEKLK